MNLDHAETTVPQLFDLTGKTALLTGGSGYLGGAMARALTEAGATVVVSSRELSRAQEVVDALAQASGRKHFALQMDHMDESSVAAGFDQAVAQSGGLDILINNGQQTVAKDWTEISADEFTHQLSNVTGYFLLARKMHEHAMARERPASIILLGSMYGLVGSYPDVYEGICSASPVAYHALKGGLVQLTRHLAVYWANDGVRVNCLSPGAFPHATADDEFVRRLSLRCPMKRIGVAQELKGAIVFLASSASSYMTGQNLVIDGGWTAW
jgi:NAD(P)-dependent dehydrogenase (short-subunit alcohol dehydrogenase family)